MGQVVAKKKQLGVKPNKEESILPEEIVDTILSVKKLPGGPWTRATCRDAVVLSTISLLHNVTASDLLAYELLLQRAMGK